MTTILCPYCETELELPNSIRGRKVSCLSCDQSFFITELGIVTRRQRSTEKQPNKCNIHSTQHKTKSPMIPILRWIGVVVLPIPVYFAICFLCYLLSHIISLFLPISLFDRVMDDLTIYNLLVNVSSAANTICFVSYIAPSHKLISACLWGGAMTMLFIIGLISAICREMGISMLLTYIASLVGCGSGIYMVLQLSEEKRP